MKSITSRLRIITEITQLCQQKKIDPQIYLRLRTERLPFKLGEGREKVPFLVDREVADTISASVQQLVDLLKKRNEREARTPLHAFMPASAPKRPKDVMERYLCTRDLSARPLAKKIAEDAIYHNPYLDAGVVEGWFLQYKDPGRMLWAIKRLYLKAIEEEIKDDKRPDIAYLTHLSLVAHLRKVKETLKKVNIKRFSYERLEQAVAQMLYSSLKEIQAEVFNETRYKDLAIDISRLEHLIRGGTNPLTFVAIRPSLFKNDLNPYYLDDEGFELLQTLAHTIALDFQNIEESLKALVHHAKRHKRLRDKLIELWSLKRIRTAVFNYLKDYEDYGGGKDLWLYHLVQSNKVIQSILTQDEAGKKFEEDLDKLIAETSHSSDKEKAQRVVGIENAVKSQKKGRALKRLFFSSREEEQLREVIEGFFLYRLDELWNAGMDESLHYLDDRQAFKKRDEIEDEYEGGRIYRLATDTRPILRDLTIKKEGHLFMDLRGFTRRMCVSKEITTADFMLKGFFLPVLEVAKKYYTDAGVRLNNLVGDAFSFSGRIHSLVALSQELREIFDAYTEQIQEREGLFSKGDEGRHVGERYRAERNAILAERKDVEKSIEGIERELMFKEFLNPVQMIKAQEEDFNAQCTHYQQQLENLPRQIEGEANPEKKKSLIALQENLLILMEGLGEQRRELAESIGSIGHDDLNDIFRLVCAEEREELERLRLLLKESYGKEAELNRAYEMEMAVGKDAGVEYGLFISYGDAAETISFDDPFWGKMNVAIAEKLNEAARGTGRNPEIKKKLDLLLKNTRRARGNPTLTYPFSVFIDKSYALSLRSDLSAMVERILQRRDEETARHVVETASALFMKDIEKGMKDSGDDGWETLTYFNDIYNLGEALSAEALQSYLRETSPHKYNFYKTVLVNDLHADIQQHFFFPSPEVKFCVCVERLDGQLNFDLFRHVGELVFRGFEIHQATAVYEIVRKNAPFYLLLEKYHLRAWYEEAKAKNEGAQAALG
jgi:hypothetical protein